MRRRTSRLTPCCLLFLALPVFTVSLLIFGTSSIIRTSASNSSNKKKRTADLTQGSHFLRLLPSHRWSPTRPRSGETDATMTLTWTKKMMIT